MRTSPLALVTLRHVCGRCMGEVTQSIDARHLGGIIPILPWPPEDWVEVARRQPVSLEARDPDDVPIPPAKPDPTFWICGPCARECGVA